MCESDKTLWKEYKKLYDDAKDEIKGLEADVYDFAEENLKLRHELDKFKEKKFINRLRFLFTKKM